MDTSNISLSDIAALLNNNGNSNMWGENGLIWLILIVVLLGAFARPNQQAPQPAANPSPAVIPMPMPQPPVQNGVTQTELADAINNQTVQQGLNAITAGIGQSDYKTAQLFSDQNMTNQQMNSTNQIAFLQAINALTQQISSQGSDISAKLDNLSHHMDDCCCEMKSTMAQQEIDRLNRELAEAKNKISNNQGAQTVLANMGRFVPWSGSGEATASVKTVAG